MRPIDSHAHIDDKSFDADRDKVLERIHDNMEFVVNVGCDMESSRHSVEYARAYKYFYATVGIHPIDIEKYNSDAEKELEELAGYSKVLAIGEIGLDYHWMTQSKEMQIDGFQRQMKLAEKLGKPVVIHSRDAMEDTIQVLNKFTNVGGILHCYPWTYDVAKKFLDRFYLGIGGVLTFKNSKKLVETVKNVPLDRLILETDCPYMSPEPLRGTRNEPCNVEYVARKIADIKNISYDEVIETTNINTKKAYHMD